MANKARQNALNKRLAIGKGTPVAPAGDGVGPGVKVPVPGKPTEAAPGTTPPKATKAAAFHPRKVLEEISEHKGPLSGKELMLQAKALTALETRPQIHGYKELATQLEKEKAQEQAGYEKLGTRLGGEVSDTYKGLAQAAAESIAREQAISGKTSSEAAALAAGGQEQLAQNNAAALGAYTKDLNLRNAPTEGGTAQQQLADAVAAQQAQANTDLNAQALAVQQQASASPALLASMASSAQMQGGAGRVAVARDIGNRTAESNQNYNSNITTAKNKLAEAKSLKGADFVKNLTEGREAGEKSRLSWAAVKGEKAAAKSKQEAEELDRGEKQLEREEGKEERGEERAENQRKYELELKKFGLNQWEAEHPNYGEHSKKRNEKKKEIGEEVKEVKALIGPVVTELGKVPDGTPQNKVLQTYISKINGKASADPTVVAKVVKAWFENRRQKEAAENAVRNFGW